MRGSGIASRGGTASRGNKNKCEWPMKSNKGYFLNMVISFLITLMIGLPIGIISAVKQYSAFDHISTSLAFVGQAIPVFWFGLILIITFSLGLAGVLTAIGVLWVQARRLFEYAPKGQGLLRHLSGQGRIIQALPAISALFITVAGLGITMQALIQVGVLS